MYLIDCLMPRYHLEADHVLFTCLSWQQRFTLVLLIDKYLYSVWKDRFLFFKMPLIGPNLVTSSGMTDWHGNDNGHYCSVRHTRGNSGLFVSMGTFESSAAKASTIRLIPRPVEAEKSAEPSSMSVFLSICFLWECDTSKNERLAYTSFIGTWPQQSGRDFWGILVSRQAKKGGKIVLHVEVSQFEPRCESVSQSI